MCVFPSTIQGYSRFVDVSLTTCPPIPGTAHGGGHPIQLSARQQEEFLARISVLNIWDVHTWQDSVPRVTAAEEAAAMAVKDLSKLKAAMERDDRDAGGLETTRQLLKSAAQAAAATNKKLTSLVEEVSHLLGACFGTKYQIPFVVLSMVCKTCWCIYAVLLYVSCKMSKQCAISYETCNAVVYVTTANQKTFKEMIEKAKVRKGLAEYITQTYFHCSLGPDGWWREQLRAAQQRL
jgi:hypothetical protein